MISPEKIFGRLGNTLFQYAYIYSQMRRGEIPDIYIQDCSYFEEYELEIRRLFGLQSLEPIDMVAIHVRRGDYVNNPFYVNLTETTYYVDAMAEFPKEDFLIFSDDISWCKRQSLFRDCEFSEGTTELEDLTLMAACKGHIIANSSFSYWGAYLSSYTQKVVAPTVSKWYTDGIERTKCPNYWIRK